MPIHLSPDQLARDLALRDLTDPDAGHHAVQLLIDVGVEALASEWVCAIRPSRGPRVVAIEDNYDNLGFSPGAASRDSRYTRYVDEHRMLRSHASAMVPAALRTLAEDGASAPDDLILVCPGIVYRRDAIDRLHTGTPHQLDIWRLARRPLRPGDLDEMCRLLVGALAPDRRWRTQPRAHPYTLAGRQLDIAADGDWVEVWECGLAHPDVLARAGLDGWHGLALGMGLDRLLMLAKGIPEIRLLRATDSRISNQMLDLAPYRPVSAMPAVTRDLSIAVDADDSAEDLGDRVRDTLGADADAVEQVQVLSETAFSDLPPSAVTRMGLRPDQKNVLVRVVLRPVDRTLTDAEANHLRDRIYRALHRGTNAEWAEAQRVKGSPNPKH